MNSLKRIHCLCLLKKKVSKQDPNFKVGFYLFNLEFFKVTIYLSNYAGVCADFLVNDHLRINFCAEFLWLIESVDHIGSMTLPRHFKALPPKKNALSKTRKNGTSSFGKKHVI